MPSTSRYTLVAEASAAGLMFVLAPVAGYFVGRWFGGWAGLGPVPSWIGAALGLVAAFLHLLRIVRRVSA